jgi:hypothetical protein
MGVPGWADLGSGTFSIAVPGMMLMLAVDWEAIDVTV